MEDNLVPIALFLVVGTVLCVFFYLRYSARREVQQTLRLAVEQGKELTPELLNALAIDATSSTHGDLRKGVIWLALAFALAISAWTFGERDLLGVASFPLMLGLAYLGLWRFSPRKSA